MTAMQGSRKPAPTLPRTFPRTALAIVMAFAMAGCASVDIDRAVATSNDDAADFTQGALQLARTPEQQRDREAAADALLAQPLDQNAAVRLALQNSPQLQALLAQSWADAANGAQIGRLPNPVFDFERMRTVDELEFGRLLAFGLLDLITLPQRYGIAQRRTAQANIRLTRDVVAHVTQVRQAWVRAVAAEQSVAYARQVNDAAQASAELGRRMQAAGNFSRLERARQQAFYADAATQWASARQTVTATRAQLERLLGLTEAQAERLRLPPRLPDLPKAPMPPDRAARTASAARLDVRLAQASYEAAARAQGLTRITSLTDIELGVRHDTMFDRAEGGSTRRNGYEVSVRLPLFDDGSLRRDAIGAQTLALTHQLEATLRAAGSQLRESYGAYRTAYDVSRHYRDEVVPLRKLIAEENVLRYNGMFISVFELLADTRAQVNSVIAAIDAERNYWLADAALQAAIVGVPVAANPASPAGVAGSAGGPMLAAQGGGDAGH